MEQSLSVTAEAVPAQPPVVQQAGAQQAGLREAVLAGRYFGAGNAAVAEALAEMVAGVSAPLSAWYGDEAARRLAAAPDALVAALTRDIAALDAMIARQLDAILHHRRVRKLEGSWRGLLWLAARVGISGRVKIRILGVTWNEICRDLERAAEFDQSHLFRAIYEDEFGVAGGEPYGLLVVDHEVRHRPTPDAPTDDVGGLTQLASIAAAAFAPLVIAASPALLGVDDFGELSGVANPAAGFSSVEYQRWKRLSTLDDARFLAVTLPRFLVRTPWPELAERHWGFRYRERVNGPADMVFATAGYLVAACVIRAFETYSWPADMRGYDIGRLGGGVVENLSAPRFSPDPAEGLGRAAMEVLLSDKQERYLVAAGLLPVSALPFGGEALVGAARSLQVPARQFIGANAAAAAASAQLSAQFNSMICAARFAHYVKIMGREMTGAFKTPAEVQRRLQDWLQRYTSDNAGAGPDTMAKYPLRQANVSVTEIPGKPGVYGCVVHLQPHFQIDDVSASFQLTAKLEGRGQR